MTYEEFIKCVREPNVSDDTKLHELQEMTKQYPFFDVAKWLYLKILYNSKSIYFGQELKKTTLYAPDRRILYFFIHPDELVTGNNRKERARNSSGSYFDVMDVFENKRDDNKKSLLKLAEKLKAARQQTQKELVVIENKPVSEVDIEVVKQDDSEPKVLIHTHSEVFDWDFTEREALAKQYISEKKYREAIVILEELNLNNSKKSIYFADQIRFLKKILEK